jgi:outer membrane biosynthesis protein TonB
MSGFSETNQERKNRSIAGLIAVTLHVLVALGLFFLTAWKAPDPPLPEYGIELNFGLDAAGSGVVQPQPEATPEAETPEENQPEEVKPEEQKIPEAVVSKTESPVVVEEPVKQTKKEEVVKKPEPVKKPVEVKKEEPVKPKPVIDPNTLYKGDQSKEVTKSPGQGNVEAAKGDQGVKEGKIDKEALYGTSGGGGAGGSGFGSGLSMSGWKWDKEPEVTLSNESPGKIVFKITVDDNGDIVGLTTLERGISPAAEKLCREEILKRKFTPLGDKVPPISEGKVTLYVKAR